MLIVGACSLPVFELSQKYGRGNGDLLQKVMPSCCASQNCCCQCPWPRGRPRQPRPPPETLKHSQARMAQSLVGSLLLFPESWCAQVLLLPPGVLLSLVLWKLHNQIPLTFKVRSPGDSQSLCRIPRLRSLFWGLELSQHSENFFDIIVLHFMGHLPDSFIGGLTATSFKRTHATHRTSQDCCCQSPCPYERPLLTCASSGDTQHSKTGLAQSLWGLWVLVHTRFCLSPLSISGRYGVWF